MLGSGCRMIFIIFVEKTMLPASLQEEILSVLRSKTGKDHVIKRASALSGGSINNAFRLETNYGNYFMKYNRASAYPGMFERFWCRNDKLCGSPRLCGYRHRLGVPRHTRKLCVRHDVVDVSPVSSRGRGQVGRNYW